METTARTLGEALRNIRVSWELSQETAAERAKVSDRSLREIELGRLTPKLTTYAALCRAYGVSLDSLETYIPETENI